MRQFQKSFHIRERDDDKNVDQCGDDRDNDADISYFFRRETLVLVVCFQRVHGQLCLEPPTVTWFPVLSLFLVWRVGLDSADIIMLSQMLALWKEFGGIPSSGADSMEAPRQEDPSRTSLSNAAFQ